VCHPGRAAPRPGPGVLSLMKDLLQPATTQFRFGSMFWQVHQARRYFVQEAAELRKVVVGGGVGGLAVEGCHDAGRLGILLRDR
jgi:hypothetical protein